MLSLSRSGLILVFSEYISSTAYLLFDRCTSWQPTDRPSITSVLQQLSSLLPRPAEVKGRDDPTVQFDHTGSLGHVHWAKSVSFLMLNYEFPYVKL